MILLKYICVRSTCISSGRCLDVLQSIFLADTSYLKKKKSYFIAVFRTCGPCIFQNTFSHVGLQHFSMWNYRALFKNSGDNHCDLLQHMQWH